MIYTIEGKDGGVNKESTIKKVWENTVEFTLSQVEQDILRLDKMSKELTAQRDLNSAKMENVSKNHDIVNTLTEEQIYACYVYQDAKAIFTASDKKIKEIQEASLGLISEKEEILKQIPELAPVEVPVPETL